MHRELIVGVLIAIAVILCYKVVTGEGFSSKREKAIAIHNWWNKNPNSDYNRYKKQVKFSDIVEYNKVKQMKNNGEPVAVNDIEKIIT